MGLFFVWPGWAEDVDGAGLWIGWFGPGSKARAVPGTIKRRKSTSTPIIDISRKMMNHVAIHSTPLKESVIFSQILNNGSIKGESHMQIQAIKKEQCPEAKEVILSGFLERFGFIDHTLNPDIQDIWTEYMQGDELFYVGMMDGRMICTGAIRRECKDTFQVVRMSVLKPYRKHGLGRRMLVHLEDKAQSLGARMLILETNKHWEDAIHFYRKDGYSVTHEDEVSCYFEKEFPM
ncbi:GNAT family N-acetyltransferase [Mangrovibacillus sp. Mu-81]|uniref:GNAT family N-acetyltransferase n=1 Tax=Mangrovibacillus sp. Mu-81 TaxID=3121478 RepID=UPI002FE4E131